MSDTPRTDELDYAAPDTQGGDPWPVIYVKMLELARELERALARYENAKLPEEPIRFLADSADLATPMSAVLATDYDALRAFAAAETVRARMTREYNE